MIERRPFNELAEADHGWPKAKHYFRLASTQTPREWDGARWASGTTTRSRPIAAFRRTHTSSEGAVTHKDSLGNESRTEAGDVPNLVHLGMMIVGLDYGHTGQMTLDEITGGSPYGATTIAGGDGSRLPTANELEGARYQGRKIAETANKLHG